MQLRALSYLHCPLQQRRVLSRCSSKDEKATPQGLCTPSVKTIPFQGQLGQHLRRSIYQTLRSPNPAPQGRKKTEAGRQFLWLSRTQLLAADRQSSSRRAPPLTFGDEWLRVVLAPAAVFISSQLLCLRSDQLPGCRLP